MAVYPTLPGCKMTVTRTPTWSTKVMKAASGKEHRVGWYSAPLYEFKLSYEVLRQGTIAGKVWTEGSTLIDFFNARAGAYESFSFTDPFDGVVRTCRFKDDKLEVERMFANLWEAKTVTLVEVR